MGVFITGSAVVLVLLQATLLLLDRAQTSWTFTLFQKSNAPDMQTLDMQACLLHIKNNKNHSEGYAHSDARCFLWYHTSQQIDPVLAQWNPHLILLAIACVHCIISLYAVQKKKLHDQAPSSYYGVYASGESEKRQICLFILFVFVFL